MALWVGTGIIYDTGVYIESVEHSEVCRAPRADGKNNQVPNGQ